MAQTQHVVDGASAPKEEVFLWDSVVSQLAKRRRGKSEGWIVQTRVAGRSIRRKLGDVGELPVEVAREMARLLLIELDNEVFGLNPKESLASFAPRFLADCANQWKPSTLEGHRRGLQSQILPHLGDISIGDLSREDVLRWRATLTYAAGTKNRALAVLSSMLRHAEILGLRAAGTNPCAGLRRRKSSFKAEYLDANAYRVLGQVLDREAGTLPLAASFVRFITLKGQATAVALVARCTGLSRITIVSPKTGKTLLRRWCQNRALCI